MDWIKRDQLVGVRYFTFLTVITVASLALSCGGRRDHVKKTSPNGLYRVEVESHVVERGSLLPEFTETVKVQYFRGQEVVHSFGWTRKDSLESTFISDNSSIEWIGENVLRMGHERVPQAFSDEVLVINNTSESLKHLGISCSKYENFHVFDVSPGGQVTLRVSPLDEYGVGYGGVTQTEKRINGVVETKRASAGSSGPRSFQIKINPKDVF